MKACIVAVLLAVSTFAAQPMHAADENGRGLPQLQDLKPVGSIRINRQGLSYELRYANVTPGEDGGEMNVDRDGRGSGTIVLAARITSSENGRFAQVENYATTPIQFNDIKKTE